MFLVREVGFEPTNPYGTGASGLRFQDPTEGLFDLAWQLPQIQALPASQLSERKALIGFPRVHLNHAMIQQYWKNV